MNLKKIIKPILIKHIIKENEFQKTRINYIEFLKNKKFANKNSKQFLFHGTNESPLTFKLIEDWDGDSGNRYDTDLPEGYLFLTNDTKEANAYGQYLIPCELKDNTVLTFKVKSDNPSREFDDDFSGYAGYGMWVKFHNNDKAVLEVRGFNKSTFITDVENVIPRIDLAIEFYNLNKK